jgi:cellulose synthase/poly-beta-1,6-N-acetylglucosamine synthase-like glycosyltransferase
MLMNCFIGLIALEVYTFLGYPLLIILLARIRPRKKIVSKSFRPSVTWVVPSYNEEAIIEEKLENLFALDYPKELLQIVVITDGSTDRTPDLARKYPGVLVLHSPERRGKSAAENRAMRYVKSDVVVFNDANTKVSSNALLEMVQHYYNPKVGGVSGSKGIVVTETDGAEGKGEGLYWKYESAIKKADSNFNSLMGAAGELVSFRTSLVQELPEDSILDDFMQSFYILKQDFIMVYEPKAKAQEFSSASIEEELKRKVRIAAGGWQSMWRLPFMWNVFKRPVQCWMYLSHRVLRWSLTALALPVIFFLNVLFITEGNGLLNALLMGQFIFYSVALYGHLQRKRGSIGIITAVYYFTIMNYAVVAGLIKFIAKTQSAQWARSERKIA